MASSARLLLVHLGSFHPRISSRSRCSSSGADGGVEPVEVPAIPGPDTPRSELIGQKLKLLAGVRACSLVVFAVHDPRLLRTQFQPALLQPPTDLVLDVLRLGLAHAVDHDVVAVPLEPDARKRPL